MTAAEELASLRERLQSYVAELRTRAKVDNSGGRSYSGMAAERIANEIEARFLTRSKGLADRFAAKVAEWRERAKNDFHWAASSARIDMADEIEALLLPAFSVSAEPVYAYGERER